MERYWLSRLPVFFVILVFFVSCGHTTKEESHKALNDNEFISHSTIVIDGYDKQTIDNLSVLCKVWGFLKYYHPVVAEGNMNWDFELFRIMPAILCSKSANERNEILFDWIEKLGTVNPAKKHQKFNSSNVKLLPDISWIENFHELEKVSQQLIKIRDAKRSGKHYYVTLAPQVGNAIFTHEEFYNIPPYPDTGFRLLTLFRYWNIIQYFFPYKYLIGEEWQDLLPEFIQKFIHADN